MLHRVSARAHPSALARRSALGRRLTVLALAVCIAALLTALVIALLATLVPSTGNAVSSPTQDGVIAEGAAVTLDDEHLPAIGRLDPGLRDALRRAQADAAAEGIAFQVTSGWRSEEYQRRLLEEAVGLHGSETVARQYVAAPEVSRHVTGDAVDIVPIDAQFWLMQHGARYGICQTYANERWHFELATQPGGVCPEMKRDAAS